MNKKVAVIIPCYNYGQYIEEAVESCLASTYKNIEIIVVDDGSTDKYTIGKLKEINEISNIKVIRQNNGGLSSARNFGFKNTDAEYVLTLDADDKIEPTFIEKGVWILENKSEFTFVYSLVQLFGEQNKVWNTSPFDFHYLKYRNTIPATILIRHSAWEFIHGYDEEMRDGYEDWEFIIRLGKNNLLGYHLNEILFYYRKHHGSMLSGSKRKHKSLVKYIKNKHRDVYKIYSWPLFIVLELKRRVLKLFEKSKFLSKKLLFTNAGSYVKGIINLIYPETKRKEIDLENNHPMILNKNDRIRVMIILPWIKVGGVEKVFLNLIKQLKDRVDFYVITTEDQIEHPWEEDFRKHAKEVQHIGSFVSINEERLLYLYYLIESLNIDIVHLSNSKFGYRVSKNLKDKYPTLKIMDTLHMEEPWSTWDYFRLSTRYKEYIDERVVLTKYQKNRLMGTTDNQKINVIPNGIELTNYEYKIKKNKRDVFHIAFIARLAKQKQPLIFLEVAKLAKSKDLPFSFSLIGTGELEGKCKKYISKNDLSDIVSFKGFTNNINNTFQNIDILCIPSILEGLPITGLEAMATGVPILATDVPGWNDLVDNGRTGILASGDANHLLLNVIELYKDENLYNYIQEEARFEVTKYTNEKMANKYFELYAKLLKEMGDDFGEE